MKKAHSRHKLALGITAALAFTTANAIYAAETTLEVNIERQSAGAALLQLARASGSQIILSPGIGQSITLPAIKGEYTLAAALDEILAGSGLVYEVASDGLVLVRESPDKKSKEKSYSNARDLEEVIVTAEKREQKLSDVPMSIVAMTGDDMEKRGIEDFKDLALAVPSLSVQDSGASQRRITLRGIGNVFGSSSLVGVYVDEMPVTGPPATHLDIRMYDLERVEVLRGPQGTLYGEGSSGGTIRFITKSPDLNEFEGSAGFATGSTRGGASSQEFEGVVNIPIIEDQLAIRISGIMARDGGWINQPARGLENINDSEVLNVRTKILWRPTENLEIGATALIHRNDSGAPPLGEDENGNFESMFSLDVTPSIDDDYELFNLVMSYDFDSVQFLSTSSQISTEKITKDFSNSLPLSPSPSPRFGQYIPQWFSDGSIFTQEFRLSSNNSEMLHWTVGTFYRDSEENALIPDYFFGTVDLPPAGPVFFSSARTSKSWAAFGQFSYTLTEKLEIGAGLRYFEDDINFDQTFGFSTSQQEKFDSVNPRVFASYSINEDTKVYANVAKGFRSGGFNTAGNPPFEPENVWTYEVGSKMSFLDGQIDAEIALFYSDYEDIQVVGLVPVGDALANLTSNIGEAVIKGIETSASWYVTDQFSVGFSSSIIDTEVTKIESVSASHAEGDELDLVPDYNYGVWMDYAFEWKSGVPGLFRLDYNEQGPSNFRNRSIGPHYFSQSDTINMLNARLGLMKDNWRVEFFGDNLLDDHGFLDSLHIELNGARVRPRTVGLKVGVDF